MSDQFHHVEADADGKVNLIIFTSAGRIKKIPMTRRELATMTTDIGVILTSDENRKGRSAHD